MHTVNRLDLLNLDELAIQQEEEEEEQKREDEFGDEEDEEEGEEDGDDDDNNGGNKFEITTKSLEQTNLLNSIINTPKDGLTNIVEEFSNNHDTIESNNSTIVRNISFASNPDVSEVEEPSESNMGCTTSEEKSIEIATIDVTNIDDNVDELQDMGQMANLNVQFASSVDSETSFTIEKKSPTRAKIHTSVSTIEEIRAKREFIRQQNMQKLQASNTAIAEKDSTTVVPSKPMKKKKKQSTAASTDEKGKNKKNSTTLFPTLPTQQEPVNFGIATLWDADHFELPTHYESTTTTTQQIHTESSSVTNHASELTSGNSIFNALFASPALPSATGNDQTQHQESVGLQFYSFFDNVDTEVDLSADPIYQQVEFQRKNPHQPLPEHLQVKKIHIPTLLPTNLWHPSKVGKNNPTSTNTVQTDVESDVRSSSSAAGGEENQFVFTVYSYKIYQSCLQSIAKHYQTYLATHSGINHASSSSMSVIQHIPDYSIALLTLVLFTSRAILSFLLRFLYAILRSIFYEGLCILLQQYHVRYGNDQRNEEWRVFWEVSVSL